MRLRLLLTAIVLLTSLGTQAQSAGRGFNGTFLDTEKKNIRLTLDLDSASIVVPGYDFLGPTHGYLGGSGIWGVWLVTSFERAADGSLLLRLSNDLGGDAQSIRLTPLDKDFRQLQYTAEDGNEIKRLVGRKLAKVARQMRLERKE